MNSEQEREQSADFERLMPFLSRLLRYLVKNEPKYRYNSRYNKVNKTPNSGERSHPFESRDPVVKRFLTRPDVNKMLTFAKMIP